MKATKLILAACPLLMVACTQPFGANNGGQGGAYQDPANPYAVPGVSTQGTYTPAAQAPVQPPSIDTAPYQPIPSTNVNIPAAPTPAITPPPVSSIPRSTVASGGSHTVVSGDTLWGLSRKYNVSVDDLRSANSLSGDTIITGQRLTIPR